MSDTPDTTNPMCVVQPPATADASASPPPPASSLHSTVPTVNRILAGLTQMTFTPVSETDATDGGSDKLRTTSLAVGEKRRLRLAMDFTIEYPHHDTRLDAFEKPIACLCFDGQCPLCATGKPSYTMLIPVYDIGRCNAGLLRCNARVNITKEGKFQRVIKKGSLLDQINKLKPGNTADVVVTKLDTYTFAVTRADSDPDLEPPEGVMDDLRQRVNDQRMQILNDNLVTLERDAMLAHPDIRRLIAAAKL